MTYYCPRIEFEFDEKPEKVCIHYRGGCTFWRYNDGECVAEVRDGS